MFTKINKLYVTDNCIQIMLTYRNYLILFGNNDLMFYKNLMLSNPSNYVGSKNIYLEDNRKDKFLYSEIPEHIERFLFFRKLYFANQILDFEKPYIKISDGLIKKIMAYKNGDEAIIHTKILNGKLCDKRTRIITREELEIYLKTGLIEQLDENDYTNICSFDMNGRLYDTSLELGIGTEKEELSKTIGEKRPISIIDDKMMIKFKQNGEITIDIFNIKYLERGKYEITLETLPVTIESLSMIKSKIKFPVIKSIKEPKISLSLNPNVTKEQLEQEKVQLFIKKYIIKR